MAIQQQDQPVVAPAAPSAEIVGNAFVHQYYQILHHSPELVYRFYNEKSKLGRPDADGGMCCVTTMQAINEKILSLDYCNCKGDILTIDSQDSFDGGVTVLVSGYLSHSDGRKRMFTQSFFLAPQDNGYYVLNDIFRYVEESALQQGNLQLPDGLGAPPLMPEQDAAPVQEQQIPDQPVVPMGVEVTNVEEVYNTSDNGDGSVVDEELPANEVVDKIPNDIKAVAESCVTTVTSIQEEAPKKSYASIVKVMKENASSMMLPVQPAAKAVPVKAERQANSQAPSSALKAVPSVTSDINAVQETEADRFSIYIKNLPMNATPAQLEEEFKRFGPIKHDGIQVRSHKQQGFCFGFVEFEVATAVQSAIEASPIMIGGRQAHVEEKRASSSRVNNNRGRFAPGRGGGFRNDGIRGGNGNYGGGRGGGYGKAEFVSRGEFVNRGNGRSEFGNRGDRGGYQRVENGGRMSRSGGYGANNTSKLAPRVTVPA